MNRKQADNIINLIQKNINTKKEEVEKVCNEDAQKAPHFASKKIENEFALLGKMHKSLNTDSNVRQIVKDFIKSKKYDDSNIKEIASTYNSKVKSIKQLEDELVKLYNKNGLTKKYNRFISGMYIRIRNIVDKNLIESSPKALLDSMNQNRNEMELENIDSYDDQKAILSSNSISKTATSNDVSELESLAKNINSFTEKYGHKISVPSKEEGFLAITRELYNTIYENITKNKILYTFLDKCKEDVEAKFDANITSNKSGF